METSAVRNTDERRLDVLIVSASQAARDSWCRFVSCQPVLRAAAVTSFGATALDDAMRTGTHLDLVLLDAGWEGRAGLNTVRRLKSLPDSPRVIVISGHGGSKWRAAAIKAGADEFIPLLEFSTRFLPLVGWLFRGPRGPRVANEMKR